MSKTNVIREGDVFRNIVVDGKSFEIRYGYYENYERDAGDPIPIYPDFYDSPTFGRSGLRIVSAIQQACEAFTPKCNGCEKEGDCGFCKYYAENQAGDMIGICQNEINKKY